MSVGSFSSPLNLQLALNPDEAPKEIRPYLFAIYNAIQQLQIALNTYAGASIQDTALWDQVTSEDTVIIGNMARFYGLFSEAVAEGALVHIVNNAGTANIRNANATTNARPCRGWCSTPGGVLAAAYGEVQLLGLDNNLVGMVPGTRYFLSTTDGLLTDVEPVAAGNIGQPVGFGLSAETVMLLPSQYWVQY